MGKMFIIIIILEASEMFQCFALKKKKDLPVGGWESAPWL